MFETSDQAFLLEIFLEARKLKHCRKHSFRKKHYERHVEKACLEQNCLRSELKKILPQKANSVDDNYFGIDYSYNGTTIDQKFSFGALGENVIKVRVAERRLLNKSDWTMIISKEHKAEFFETQKLALFVKKNWGLVQKRLVEKKQNFAEYAISLEDFYRIEKIEPIITELNPQSIEAVLEELKTETGKSFAEQAMQQNETIIDDTKRICFEPAIAAIALQIFGNKT